MSRTVTEYQNSLKQRVGSIAYVKEIVGVNGDPSTYENVVSNIVINLTLGFSKPLMVLDDDIIERCFIKEVVTTPIPATPNGKLAISLRDEIYEHRNNGIERFVYIGDIVDPLSSSKSMLMYDRRYNDIVYAPSIADVVARIDLNTAKPIVIDTVGATVGYYDETNTDLFINENVGIAEYNHYSMPEFTPNMSLTAMLITIPGSDPDTAFKDTNYMEKIPGSESFIVRGETRPRTFIKLGKTSEFIQGNNKSIPLHYPYWYSPTSMKLAFGSITDSGDKNVYFELGS